MVVNDEATEATSDGDMNSAELIYRENGYEVETNDERGETVSLKRK